MQLLTTPEDIIKLLITITLLLVLLLLPQSAQALRCGSKLVKTGDPVSRLQRNCPEPFWIERWSTPALQDNSIIGMQLSDGLEAWYLNFGTRKLVRRILVRNGVLVGEQTLGYGFTRAPEKQNCSGTDLDRAGNTLVDLYRRCGPPDQESVYPITVYPQYGYTIQPWHLHHPGAPVVIYRLVWTYYPKRGQTRVFHFEDGNIVQRQRVRD